MWICLTVLKISIHRERSPSRKGVMSAPLNFKALMYNIGSRDRRSGGWHYFTYRYGCIYLILLRKTDSIVLPGVHTVSMAGATYLRAL